MLLGDSLLRVHIGELVGSLSVVLLLANSWVGLNVQKWLKCFLSVLIPEFRKQHPLPHAEFGSYLEIEGSRHLAKS